MSRYLWKTSRSLIPLYKRTELTDKLHEICHFNTDFEFITKSQMRTIQKKVKENKILFFKFLNCQRKDIIF